MKLNRAILSLTLGILLAASCGPASVRAETPIFSFEASPSSTQAGGHPDILTGWQVGSHEGSSGPTDCCSDAKNFVYNNPPGVIGDPHAVPQCSQVEFATFQCPVDSQVGIASFGSPGSTGGLVPVYNLEPNPSDAGRIAWTVPLINVPIYEIFDPRTESDYGLQVATVNVPFHAALPTTGFYEKLWGVPASPIHDPLRFPYAKGHEINCFGDFTTPVETAKVVINWTRLVESPHHACEGFPEPYSGETHSNSEERPFLSNPTTCGVPLTASLRVDSYDGESTEASYPWPATTGCDQLSFNPSLFAQPTASATDTPSGIDVDLRVPQPVSPDVPSPSEIRAATVVLPQGFTINPGAADGKTVCRDQEARFGTKEEAQCSDFSKVGSLSISSSALPATLPGYVYLGQPKPGDPYRLVLTANGFGIHVKLAGSAIPDRQTGQLRVVFEELPQSPFNDFNMHFFGSERGLLATPTQCGTYPVTSTFTPWDSLLGSQTSTQPFSLSSGPDGRPCPGANRPFEPNFSASSSNSGGGAHSPFALDVSRPDGDQNVSGLMISTPPGFSATLKGIPYCPETALASAAQPGYSGLLEQAHASCPIASQVGDAIVGVGAGAHPLYVAGKVYLAGPYKGAPLSLAVITPAVSGPYDLGTVLVRAALQVDPATAQVTAVSDPLPQILEGIPLRLRSVRVELNRPEFVLNPTNCEPLSIAAQIGGSEGLQAIRSAPFQVANCAEMPFGPKLALNLSGGVNRLGHPAIHAVVRTRPGEANPRSISVTLPPNELLDQAHFDSVCTKVDFAAQRCPAGSLIGNVQVASPLLDQPLTGNVYLRSSGRGLPDLALDLRGQIDIEASAQIDAVHGGLRTTFKTIPDVPLGKIVLNLQGGSKGLIQNSEGLCGAHFQAAVAMRGQNGRAIKQRISVRPACGKQKKHQRRPASRGERRGGRALR